MDGWPITEIEGGTPTMKHPVYVQIEFLNFQSSSFLYQVYELEFVQIPLNDDTIYSN